ncbi:MAG: tungsten cofactor oxidoreductase radical SAM maturase [Anaerolineales bacterium]
MTKRSYAHVDEHGNLILPAEQVRELGLQPGDSLPIEANDQGISLRPSVNSLRRVYVEVTNKCNLNCATCMRNVWDVNYGRMTDETFARILLGLQACSPKPDIFFGGYGEPLSHPRILTMIEQAKAQGHHVSLITNGTLLNRETARQLIELQLDMLWVSLDGATPECYADVRLGDALPTVLENLKQLQLQKHLRFGDSSWSGYPKLGIAFVAMQRNIQDLEAVIKLGTRLGAVEFSISNVLAHNPELHAEELYERTLNLDSNRYNQPSSPLVYFPVMDVNDQTSNAVLSLLKSANRLEFFGGRLTQNIDQCPFVERGSLSVRWDGKVSPCLPLMYTHQHYLAERERTSHAFFVGDLNQEELTDIWNQPEYLALRKRLQEFDFSPCTFCNSCEMAGENQEDCFGNTHPTCGGCLWAQGLIRCP